MASGLIQLVSAIVGYWRPSAHTNAPRMNNRERERKRGAASWHIDRRDETRRDAYGRATTPAQAENLWTAHWPSLAASNLKAQERTQLVGRQWKKERERGEEREGEREEAGQPRATALPYGIISVNCGHLCIWIYSNQYMGPATWRANEHGQSVRPSVPPFVRHSVRPVRHFVVAPTTLNYFAFRARAKPATPLWGVVDARSWAKIRAQMPCAVLVCISWCMCECVCV